MYTQKCLMTVTGHALVRFSSPWIALSPSICLSDLYSYGFLGLLKGRECHESWLCHLRLWKYRLICHTLDLMLEWAQALAFEQDLLWPTKVWPALPSPVRGNACSGHLISFFPGFLLDSPSQPLYPQGPLNSEGQITFLITNIRGLSWAKLSFKLWAVQIMSSISFRTWVILFWNYPCMPGPVLLGPSSPLDENFVYHECPLVIHFQILVIFASACRIQRINSAFQMKSWVIRLFL